MVSMTASTEAAKWRKNIIRIKAPLVRIMEVLKPSWFTQQEQRDISPAEIQDVGRIATVVNR